MSAQDMQSPESPGQWCHDRKIHHCGRVPRLQAEYARVRPSTPEYARVRPSTPEYARVCPSTPEYARVRPSTPEYARVRPSTPESYPVIPGHTRAYPGIPGHTRSYPVIPGHTRSYPVIPGHTVPWFSAVAVSRHSEIHHPCDPLQTTHVTQRKLFYKRHCPRALCLIRFLPSAYTPRYVLQ